MSPAQKRPRAIQIVDIFAGCGGLSAGFANASNDRIRFQLKGAIDLDAHANATYERMIGLRPIHGDVRKYATKAGLERLRRVWNLDASLPLVMVGGPPCQGFSSHRKKDDRIDGRNTLLEAYARLAVGLRADVVVLENVPEMLHSRHWHYFDAWRKILTRSGYSVRTRIYNVAQFGVAQERFRILAIARPTGKPISMPTPRLKASRFRTVRDAIGGLPALEAGGRDPGDPMHMTSKHRPETVRLLSLIPKDGGSRRSLPAGVGPRCLEGVDGFRDVYGRLAWDRPSVAITARCRTPSCGRFAHPEQNRGLSVREAALLQGFPKRWFFEGPFDDKFKQIGNAVSPMFAEAIAREVSIMLSNGGGDLNTTSDVIAPIEKSFASAIAGIKRRMRESAGSVLSPL